MFLMRNIIALMIGALLPLAFSPWSYYPLAIISPCLLLFVWKNQSPRNAFWQGLLYGIGVFGIGVSWIFISIHQYGNTSIFLSSLITALFIFILALFPALQGYVLNRFFTRNHFAWLMSAAALGTLLEWIRSWIFSGFPWLLLGDSQINSPLRGFAPIVGVYGVTFIVLLSASILYAFFNGYKRWLNLLLLASLWITGAWLSQMHWTIPASAVIRVSLIQGNIPQSIKWSSQQALTSLQRYETLTQQQSQSQLILWPETAITLFQTDATPYLTTLDQIARQHHQAIITGIPMALADTFSVKYYNSIMVMGQGEGFYLKRHLVPFGEYVPFEKYLRGLFGFLNLPMSDFSAGPPRQPPLTALNLSIAPFICYEVAYPHLIRSNLPNAQLLITLSNDTWFDQSAALAQHRQIAQFAALSTGRYMLVATNSGESVIINPKGKIIANAPIDQIAVISGTITAMKGSTPWITFGNWPILLLIILILFISKQRR